MIDRLIKNKAAANRLLLSVAGRWLV